MISNAYVRDPRSLDSEAKVTTVTDSHSTVTPDGQAQAVATNRLTEKVAGSCDRCDCCDHRGDQPDVAGRQGGTHGRA